MRVVLISRKMLIPLETNKTIFFPSLSKTNLKEKSYKKLKDFFYKFDSLGLVKEKKINEQNRKDKIKLYAGCQRTKR